MKLGTLVHHVHGYKTLPQMFYFLKWEGLAWVRHSSTGEELDKCLEAKCREKP